MPRTFFDFKSMICPSRVAECARVCVCVQNIFHIYFWSAEGDTNASLWCCTKLTWWSLKIDALDGYLAFSVQLKALGRVWLGTQTGNNRQQIGCSQAKLICFHLQWRLPQVQFKNCVCLPVTLPMSLSLCGWIYIYSKMCFTVLWCVCVFSGGRNIVVTGSGFDIIQTAVLKVNGDNSTAFEVCASIFFYYPLFISIFLRLSISLLIIHFWKYS